MEWLVDMGIAILSAIVGGAALWAGMRQLYYAIRQTTATERGVQLQEHAGRQAVEELARQTLAALQTLRDDLERIERTLERIDEDRRGWVRESLSMHGENRTGITRIEAELREWAQRTETELRELAQRTESAIRDLERRL